MAAQTVARKTNFLWKFDAMYINFWELALKGLKKIFRFTKFSAVPKEWIFSNVSENRAEGLFPFDHEDCISPIFQVRKSEFYFLHEFHAVIVTGVNTLKANTKYN